MATDPEPKTLHADSVSASDLAALLGGAESSASDEAFAAPESAPLPKHRPEPPAEARADLAALAGATVEPAPPLQRPPERQLLQPEIDALLARLLGS